MQKQHELSQLETTNNRTISKPKKNLSGINHKHIPTFQGHKEIEMQTEGIIDKT